ncbi:MAG: putative DNA binding domain-containing protein [Chitinophagaceae bacterium]|nr:putative DNA binding domain-containing protein [Chitinophagaceae bacterium]
MDYCTSHFGKRLNDLTIQDIESYFQQERIETDQLEFKSISQHGNLNDKILGIQRSICAFLNSSGGLLIWGAPEGKKYMKKKKRFTKVF